MPHKETNPVTADTPSLLKMLYGNKISWLLRATLTKPFMSHCAGWFCDTRLSAWCINSFIQSHNINMDEALYPVSSYKTFNEFFTRKLKKGARPFDQRDTTLISPADGTIIALEHIDHNTTFPVKQLVFNLEQFLQDESLAKKYYGGTIILIRLAPWDYHRFHFPCVAVADTPAALPGKYESVHPWVYQCGIQPLLENIRHRYLLHTASFDDILIMSVGALFVGSITETYIPGVPYSKGAEMGYFSFGGSTLVLLFKADQITLDERFSGCTSIEKEIPIKMGTVIAYKKGASA